ncbi:MAG: class I SAM-dependent methyltransferase [Saccharofermentanales bacterium]
MKKNKVEQLADVLKYFNDMIENPVSLVSLKIVLISGKNKNNIEVKILNDDGNILFFIPFIGKSMTIAPDGFIQAVTQHAALYDGIEIYFYERGGGRKITADDRNVKISTIEQSEKEAGIQDCDGMSHSGYGVSQTRDYYIRVDEASVLLQAIGVTDENNKVRNDKIRKYNQIDRFVEMADPVIQEAIRKKETIRILDCACGKSYLSFVLNYYIKEKLGYPCEFLGLDWSESVIDSSYALAKKLKYANMDFQQCDLSKYDGKNFRPTLCISLHACDTATDYAIYTGIRSHSKAIMCVPCCQKELLNSDFTIPVLEKNILSHGILKTRFSDLLTDSMRVLLMEANGYVTTVTEYISPLDSPKNILISGLSGDTNKETAEMRSSFNEYQALKKQFHCDITLGKLLYEAIPD